MKLNASTRLRAARILEALLKMPVRNDTQRGYLVVIANMVLGDRPVGRDCRSVVAKYIAQHPSTGGSIMLVAHKDNAEIYHCLLVDHEGRTLADALNGKLENGLYTHNSGNFEVSSPAVASALVKDFIRHLVGGTFESWVNQYPNN